MSFDENTVWFITGTASGVGEAVALAALNHGHRVVATARRPETLSIFGVLNVLRATLPGLRKQRAGHVVEMSSQFGQMSYPATGTLAATKHAVGGVTAALAQELAPLGVRFTMIESGAIDTPFMSNSVATETDADYEGTVGAVLRSLTQIPAEELLSVTAVATAITRVATTDQPPLHLAVGQTAAEAIHTELAARMQELEDEKGT
jgi:NADP-dependent 3-hydroxy acid dehydrogenase YdfG